MSNSIAVNKNGKSGLFIRTSKCATSVISILLEPKIEETRNYFFLDHEVNRRILRENRHLFKFSIVRDPYNRAFSCWKYATTTCSGGNAKMDTGFIDNYLLPPTLDFVDFLSFNLEEKFNLCSHSSTHIMPITDYLGAFVKNIDYFMRVENIQNDLLKIADMVGFNYKTEDCTIVYPTPYEKEEKVKLLSDRKIIDLINQKYKNDFITFKYEMF